MWEVPGQFQHCPGLKKFYFYFFILERNEGKGRERHRYETDELVALCMRVDWGLNLKPGYVP